MNSFSADFDSPQSITCSATPIWLANWAVRAGFPSPAEDLAVSRLDIATLLVKHPQATFLLRVAGPSMREEGIEDGDLVLVDRAIRPRHGHIVVAILESELTIKKLYQMGGIIKLKAGNPTFPDIVPKEAETLEIFGVVTNSIKCFI